MNREWNLIGAGLCALVTGCTDPIVGDWEVKDSNACGRGEFTVDDNLEGDGTIFMVGGEGCLTCSFELTVEEPTDGTYDADIDFDVCHCDGDRSAKAECRMNSAEDELDCTLDMGSCGEITDDFEKQL